MKFTIILALASLAVAAPRSDDYQLVITREFFPEKLVVYTAEHDIVDIMIPQNHMNFPEDGKEVNKEDHEFTFFFVEADVKDNGEKEYKGLYVFKNNVAKKVLDNGQCSTYAKNRTIYFGASDGIYKYNEKDQTATKYGTVTDDIISLAIDPEHANVYYLTSDYRLYKFDEDEKVATKVEAVKDARDMVIDYDGIMFYYDGSNQLYTYDGERVLKMEGLPAHPSKVMLIRALSLMNQVSAVIDGRLYALNTNGTIENQHIKLQAKPTAFAPDILLLQYYAYKQKLYMYDLLTMFVDINSKELDNYVEGKEDQINKFKTHKLSHKL